MINQDQTIPCPTCGTKITFNTKDLLIGVQFTCPNCKESFGLATEHSAVVEEAMRKLEELKKKAGK